MKITRVAAPKCRGGENPLWDPDYQKLFYIDNSGKKIHCHDPATLDTQSWDMPSVITTLALRQGGGGVVTLLDGIHHFDFEASTSAMLYPLDDSSEFIFNDGKVDRSGRFILGGSIRNFANPTTGGGLFSLEPNGALKTLDRDIHVSNGPCFSPDDSKLYFSDSWINTCYAYDYDLATGQVAGRRPFVNTEKFGGRPDGATVDRDGLVWMAIYGGGKIVAFRPDGQSERVIDMPVKLVSSVMFGGPALDRLYVTTIEHGAMGETVERDAGALYVIDGLGARGIAESKYGGDGIG